MSDNVGLTARGGQIVVARDKEDTKRYDFEAQSVNDAAEIVEEIRRGMEPYGGI